MKPLPIGSDEMHALASALRKISFFAGLSMKDLEGVLSVTGLYEYKAGAMVFKKGQVGDALYIVHTGAVDILAPRFLRPAKKLATLRAGEFFGEMALINQPYRTAHARADGPTTLFVVLNTRIQQVLSGNPAFAKALADVAARRAFESKAQLEA